MMKKELTKVELKVKEKEAKAKAKARKKWWKKHSDDVVYAGSIIAAGGICVAAAVANVHDQNEAEQVLADTSKVLMSQLDGYQRKVATDELSMIRRKLANRSITPSAARDMARSLRHSYGF